MRRLRLLVALPASLALGFLAPSASLAEIVHLKDGTRVVGAVRPTVNSTGGSSDQSDASIARDAARADAIVVATIDGDVVVPKSTVCRVDERATLEKRVDSLKELAPTTAADRWRAIACFAARKGLFDTALDAADTALMIDARAATGVEGAEDVATCDSDPLNEEILALPVAGIHRNEPLAADSTRTLLVQSIAASQPARAEVARRRVHGALAAAGDAVPKPVLAALSHALADVDPKLRGAALDAIAAARAQELSSVVVEHLLRDKDEAVRRAALECAAALHDPDSQHSQRALAPILKSLENGDAKARAAAMDALELLSDAHAVASLIRTLAGGGGFTGFRANMSATNQVAYVSDFDVEVAQASAIADPIVSVAQEGTVLDVTIYGTHERGITREERERIARLLERLTGRSHGTDAKAWQSWLESK